MFILDTNVVSELRRPQKANASVLKWAAQNSVQHFFLSVITMYELERGMLMVAKRNQGHAEILRRWIDDQVLKIFAGRILSIDESVALRCAQMLAEPATERDCFIAASALIHGMTVVTRNVLDFEKSGAPLFNPWL
jgi:toxin FitB